MKKRPPGDNLRWPFAYRYGSFVKSRADVGQLLEIRYFTPPEQLPTSYDNFSHQLTPNRGADYPRGGLPERTYIASFRFCLSLYINRLFPPVSVRIDGPK